jgi:hypothetical protein
MSFILEVDETVMVLAFVFRRPDRTWLILDVNWLEIGVAERKAAIIEVFGREKPKSRLRIVR